MGEIVCSSGARFDILNDDIVEDDQSFSLTILSADPDVLTFGSPSEFTVIILDDSDCELFVVCIYNMVCTCLRVYCVTVFIYEILK